MGRGLEYARELWAATVHGRELAGKNQIALGEHLILDAIQRGDVQSFNKLVSEVAAEATRAGQTAQAISMLKRLSPEGQLMSLHRQVDRLNEQLENNAGASEPAHVELNPELEKKYMETANEIKKARRELHEAQQAGAAAEEIEKLKARIAELEQQLEQQQNDLIADAAEQLPKRLIDKLNAWRYLAMLGNPRTHIRNIVGNGIFMPVVKTKNAIAAMLEGTLGKKLGERTKTLRRASEEVRTFAKKDAAAMQTALTTSGKYNPTAGKIEEAAKPFSEDKALGRVLNKLSDWNGNALEAEDWVFLRAHYVSALANYMTANRLSPDAMTEGSPVLQKAREYAVREAQKATYRDANALASFLSDASRRLKKGKKGSAAAGYAFLEGLVPFKKTPANIIKRGIEYSPVGLMKALTTDIADLRRGDINGAEYIDRFASGFTGTMVVALGAALAALGIARGTSKDDDDDFEKLQGAQDYSLQVGDTSYTVDWAAPISMPFFVGVELWRAINGEWENATASDVLDALSQITEPIFNLSMLDGIQSSMQSFSKEDAITDAAWAAFESFISQMVPTIGGQIARAIDPTSRNAYYNDKNSKLPQKLQTLLHKNMQKIPGLSKLLPERIDAWGRTTVDDSLVSRIAQNFASPGYWKNRNTTEVDVMLQEIYEATGETSVLPSKASTHFTHNGETYNLSAKEYVKFAEVRGQTAWRIIDEMRKDRAFQAMDDAEKVKYIEDAYKLSTAIAKMTATNSGYNLASGNTPKWYAKAFNENQLGKRSYARYILERKR